MCITRLCLYTVQVGTLLDLHYCSSWNLGSGTTKAGLGNLPGVGSKFCKLVPAGNRLCSSTIGGGGLNNKYALFLICNYSGHVVG